ncbi:MAG: YHS domain-containing protein [Pseudomonadota bacterium]
MHTTVKDPVCGMEVEPHRNEIIYLRMHFAFCSPQCKERFLAHPHAYIGYTGQQAPKQEGREVLKRRRLHLAVSLSPPEVEMLVEELKTMMGIRDVTVAENTVEITYDLMQVTSEQIEAKLAQIGVHLGEGWAERLRRAFVHYEEECELGNLEVRDPHFHG